MTGLRHVRARSGYGNNNSQSTISGSNTSTNLLSQKRDMNSSHPSSEKRRGRHMRATVELRVPPRGRKVGLQPNGERQFKYVPYHPKNYKYTTQLGVLLKREYPGKIEEKNDVGVITNTRPALEWYDCYHNSTLDFQMRTAADRVKEEFWNLFDLHVDDEEDESARIQTEQEANQIIDAYARKKVKDMLYQLRVDAVKLYYENQGEKLDDSMACARELEYEQYLHSRIPWCKEVAWPGLCRYWTSKEYKTNRRRGREARLKSEDIAQNRGGSRPFVEVQQYLEETLGPEKATTLNTYTAMKCGMKNVSTNGNNGAIISNGATMSQKAKKRLDDYTTLVKEKYPDSWEGRELDGELLYEASGGIPHGRVSIGDGAVKKADIKSAARKRNSSAPISLTLREKEQLRRVNEENAELRRDKEMLQQKVDVHGQLITALFKEVGKKLPAHILHILSHGAVSQPEGTNNSSQAGSQAVDGNNDVMHSSEENDTAGNVGDQTVDSTNHGGN